MKRALMAALAMVMLLPAGMAAAEVPTEEWCKTFYSLTRTYWLGDAYSDEAVDEAYAAVTGPDIIACQSALNMLEASGIQAATGLAEVADDATLSVPRLEVPEVEVTTAVTSPPQTGAWLIGELEKDPLTDEPTALLGLNAESGANRFGDPVGLFIRCRNGDTELFIACQDYLGSDDPRVTMRIGNAKATRQAWNLSTSKDSTFYPRDATWLIRLMFGETQFVAQTQPYNEGNVTAVFDISGIEDAVANVREACGW